MEPLIINKIIISGKCTTKGCKNDPKGRKFCGLCRSKQSRLKDPERYAYNNLKSSAAKRDIYFDLTIEEFRKFCVKTSYIGRKGRTINSCNVDRIIEGKLPGYTKGNIQCLDKQKNIKKYYNQYEKRFIKDTQVDTTDNPF